MTLRNTADAVPTFNTESHLLDGFLLVASLAHPAGFRQAMPEIGARRHEAAAYLVAGEVRVAGLGCPDLGVSIAGEVVRVGRCRVADEEEVPVSALPLV